MQIKKQAGNNTLTCTLIFISLLVIYRMLIRVQNKTRLPHHLCFLFSLL